MRLASSIKKTPIRNAARITRGKSKYETHTCARILKRKEEEEEEELKSRANMNPKKIKKSSSTLTRGEGTR